MLNGKGKENHQHFYVQTYTKYIHISGQPLTVTKR